MLAPLCDVPRERVVVLLAVPVAPILRRRGEVEKAKHVACIRAGVGH